eukprot:339219_1
MDETATDEFNTTLETTMYSASTDCEPQVIQKPDCTQWLYVYMTTALSVTLSTLCILCFWLYYRQGIKPVTKGYKRSNSESDVEQIIKSKKRKKMSKLLGIDENKVIAQIKIKKNRKGQYGSIAQSDEDEKYDHDHPFDLDVDSERSDRDEWNFVNGDQNKHNRKKQNQYGASASDQTDEE